MSYVPSNHGKAMGQPNHLEQLQHYAAGAEKLSQAIRGLTLEDLLRVPDPEDAKTVGRWTIQEVVIHLADAEAAFVDRIKRIIAEDEPTLLAWNETRFAERLAYAEQSAQDAAKIFELSRHQLTRILKTLPPEAFDRAGLHSERGKQTLSVVLGYAIWHLDHHLKFINAKREKFGELMW